MSYFVPVYTSALSGQRLNKIMENVEKVYERANHRISTSMLNEILSNAVSVNEPPSHNGKRCKIYYMTQASVTPPTFVVFLNDKNLMHFSYERYLENSIREAVDFSGTPIRLVLKSKSDKEQ
jgi:GTP-binding protein